MSLAFLPFAPLAARAIEALVADDEVGENPFKTRYLDERSLDQPSLALGQATREALRMADVAQGMFRDVAPVFGRDNQELLENVEQRDDQLDFLEREIKLFLARLSRETVGPELSRRELREYRLGRLRAGLAESLESAEIHLDILANLKRISSHVSALVFPILEEV